MEQLLLPLSVLVSFFLVLTFMPKWIRKCRNADLLWEDMNKFGHPRNVASSGGIIVVMAFVLGVFSYIAFKTFFFGGSPHTIEVFALISVILIFSVIGLVDDLLGWKSKGLPFRARIALAFMAAIPLVVINAGTSLVTLPFLGTVNLGVLYPLVIIPIGVACAAGTYNFLAGFNGLEAGQGILILSFLSFVAFVKGSPWLAIVGLCMVASLIAFYLFNRSPAKVFPGDIMTYAIGALIAGMAVLGDFIRLAIIVFIPYIIEVFLKLRGRLRKHSFGIPQSDGTLDMPFVKVYGLEHLAIAVLNRFGRATEKKVTYLIHSFQILFILFASFLLLLP